jgi:uncharacterized protein (TIGR02301 family)
MCRIRKVFLMLTLLAAIAAMGVSRPSGAQENGQAEGEPDAPQVRVLPPAYDSQMLKLAEILGALHYLRELCGAGEGQVWRDEMERLLEAEEPSEQRRAQLVAHFNRGFRGYREIHRECTPAAAEAANQHLRQGVRIATDIPNRFGN